MMTTTSIPRKAPDLLAKLVNNDYGYVVNCSFPNSFRILTRKQFDLVNSVNSQDDITAIAEKFDLSADYLERLFLLLGKTQIIRFDDRFTSPKKPDNLKSLNFWIHTTNACNLGCSYCYISTLNTGKGMTVEVRDQLIKQLVQTVKNRGIKYIKLRLAGGEPLGQFKSWKTFIPQAAAKLRDLRCKLDIAFVTNLTLLNDDIITFSKRHNIKYGVSLDGIQHTHDATRKFRSGNGSFDTVDSNLKKLLKEDIPVSVNTVLTDNNLSGLPELTQYLIDLNVPFRYSIVKGGTIDGELLENSLSKSYRIMADAIERGWQFSKKYQFCDLKPTQLGFQTCTSGFSGGAIYVNGDLKYCHVHFGQEDLSSNSIFNDDIDLVEMIEQGPHLEDIRSNDCQQCRYRSVCTSGCPVYRVNGKDPHCSLYHRLIPWYYDLQAKERLNLMQKHGIV